MNDILKRNNLTKEDIDKLVAEDLREFSALNKELFRLNNDLIEEFKKNNKIS